MSEHCNKNTPKVLQVPCCDQPTLFHKVTIPASIGDEETNPPLPGKYRNTLLFYEANNTAYLYSSDGIPTLVSDMSEISRLEKMIEDEEDERKDADDEIWAEIETIEASSDVVDVVGTYAELQAYDTSKLHDKDLIKVLADETHDGAITYYRWSTTTETFSYVGEEGPYYTQSQTDTLLGGKQDTLIAGSNIQIAADGKTISATDTTYTAGANVQISNENVISATDTTYTHFTGATASTDGVQGLVPGPLAGDEDKVLKGDGTWGTVQSASNTIFYRNSSETGATRHIYKNPDMTGLASMQDLLDANETGQVILRLSTASHPEDFSDAYLQNAYVGTSDYQMLFLDEKAYTSFDTTSPADTTFYYSRRELQDKLTAGTNIQINGATISATDTTYSDFTGATSLDAGAHGLVPAPAAGDEGKFLSGAGTWETVTSGGSYSAGNGINIDANNEISIDTSVVAEVSDIPTNTSDLVNDGSDGTSTYVEADELATVATSGSYADLLNTPTIPAAQVNSDWNANSGVAEILNKPTLATVATSGSYNDLLNQPTIPAAQVNSDWNANSGVAEILNKPSLAAVATSGAYSDLTGTPTIPTVNNATLTVTQNGTSAGTFTANASSDVTVALTDTTYSDFVGATSSVAGSAGLVPAPTTSDTGKVLKGDGTWGEKSEKFVIMKYGEANAWTKFLAAYNENAIVYCRASSNANPGTGSQTRLAFMAYVSNETSPTSVEFQYVRSVGTKTSSQPVDQVFVYKLESTNGGTWSVQTRDMAPKLAAGTNASVSYSNGTYTVSATDTTYSAGTNVQISAGNVISATDTTYSAFTGTDGQTAGTTGLVPAPATTDAGKFLKADGTWDTAGGGGSAGTTFYITDVGNSDVPGCSSSRFPQNFRIFKDDVFTDEVELGDIMDALRDGPVNVVISEVNSPNLTYPGVIVSSYDSAGSAYFYMYAQYSQSQMDAKIFRCVTLMNIPGSTTSFLWQSTSQNAMPSIPAVYNGTLTIQHNGTDVQTFTANSSSSKTANIETIYADTIAPVSTVGSITTSNLADEAVTSAKIDWETLPYAPTVETVVGQWADGSPVYRKAFQVPTGPKSGVDVNISLGNSVTNVINVKGFLTKSGDFSLLLGSERVTSANGIGAYFSVSNHTLIIEAGADRSAFSGYVVVDYLK